MLYREFYVQQWAAVGENRENMVNVNAEQVEEFLLNDEAVYICVLMLMFCCKFSAWYS